jgi:hypothetical protein
MYFWMRGERILTLMVMWEDGQPVELDARALAELMDGRAGS